MDDETVIPEKVVPTLAKRNDRSQLNEMVDEPDCTYVFGRGYLDYAKFDDYCENGLYRQGTGVCSDEMVYVGTPQKRMENVLRLIHTVNSEGNLLVIVTNRFDLDADEVRLIYRER